MRTCAGAFCATSSISQPSGSHQLKVSEQIVSFFGQIAHFLPFSHGLICLLPVNLQSAQMRTCAGAFCATSSISQPSGSHQLKVSEQIVSFFGQIAHFLPFSHGLICLLPVNLFAASQFTSVRAQHILCTDENMRRGILRNIINKPALWLSPTKSIGTRTAQTAQCSQF